MGLGTIISTLPYTASLQGSKLSRSSIITQEHHTTWASDYGKPLHYPGKIAKLKEMLKKEGVGVEKIEKVKGAIGLGIGTKTPEEIAVSIVAELIKQGSSA
ncbi:MAG: XdhC family protein [Methanobacteriota archaeon]